jgi:hypothetical protein
MSLTNTTVQTIKCDAPGCDKELTFAQSQTPEFVKNNPWLRSVRIVQGIFTENPQIPNKVFVYCSDTCEVNGTGTGKHNPIEKKLVEMPTGEALAAVRAAAQAAEATRVGDQALREGKGINVVPA